MARASYLGSARAMALAPATGRILRRRVAGFVSAVDTLRGDGFDISAAGTVPPALAAAFASADWEEAVRTVVCLGGDTDTLGCITGAVAEAIHGLPDAIVAKARNCLTDDLREVLDRFQKSHVARL